MGKTIQQILVFALWAGGFFGMFSLTHTYTVPSGADWRCTPGAPLCWEEDPWEMPEEPGRLL